MHLVGRLTECLLLAYSTPAASVADMIPKPLKLVTCNEKAFWNIVLSRIQSMRLQGTPRFAGMSYYHVAYRLYVRTHSARGLMTGLYFVRSDVDQGVMSWAGNLLTDFRFNHSAIRLIEHEQRLDVSVYKSTEAKGDLELSVGAGPTNLGEGSAFTSDEMRETVLKYEPVAIAVAKDGWIRLARVERSESSWREVPVRVERAEWNFFGALGQDKLCLERATRVAPIDYTWRIGEAVAPE